MSNIRSYAVNTVPEHAFALILALRPNIVAYRESVRRASATDDVCSTLRSVEGAAIAWTLE